EPLKPTWPEEAQAITAPEGSVIETIVLLKVLLMCACPCAMFFFSLRRVFRAPVRVLGGMSWFSLGSRSAGRWGQGPRADYLRAAFFLPATVRLGPLRVRALVLVRCPRTGRPRR